MWIKCFVLASETGTSTTLSLKSTTLTIPFAKEIPMFSDLAKALSSPSNYNEIPEPLSLSVCAFKSDANPAKRYFKLLYFNSNVL